MTTVRKASPSIGYLILAVLVAIGAGVGIVRLINGLGATTSLSDGYPWGLWIVYDVFFVPFSAGAFMILAITHIYNRKEYHPIARPVVLAGFLGEVMVIVVLVMDLGRWNQFYNVLFPWYWNIRSFMFQVSICLTIYMGVMVLEIAPSILERLNWQKPLRLIRMATVLIAGTGIVLSALHQSSLGSLFLLMPYKLHPLWWTPMLPLLFFTSAAIAGLSMAIFVAAICFRVFKCSLQLDLLSNLARVVAVLLGIYLLLKVGDLALAGELGLIFSQGWLSLLFLAELALGVIAPLVLFSIRKVRENSGGLIAGAGCVLLGLAINRTSVALVAQQAPAGASYFPHWMEITISAAAVAAGILLFIAAVRFLPILPEEVRSKQSSLYPHWSRRAVVFVGGALSLIVITVVLLLQPMTQAGATKSPLTSAQIQAPQRASCLPCHQDPQALAAAGVAQDEIDRLTIVPQPPETPHGRLDCVTCHYGDGATEDLEAAHRDIVRDPTVDDGGLCVACHSDLPEELPQDRLRTPHDEVSHGELADVSCSDCHGGVGHGFDPVSGEIICPMAVCLDCHISRQLDSELTDCDACHISAHDAVPSINCNQCHQSTEEWTEVGTETHPLELVGKHAEAPCLDCHRGLNLVEATHCGDCHQPPSDSHYGAQCEDCHTPAGFQQAELLDHPIPLEGAHQRAACAGCHTEGQQSPEYVCSECHQPPENHLSGPCTMCHTPEGWTSSTAFITNLAPQISHALEGQEDCLMCHALASKVRPAPSNHGDYTNAQCVLCHKVAP
jgi:Ni/Fe-hydrogenase subunit HybB-like protein